MIKAQTAHINHNIIKCIPRRITNLCMDKLEALENLKSFEAGHSRQWNPKFAPYKCAASLDFGSESFQKTDIDSSQVASDLSVMLLYEEKFTPHNEFFDDKSLAVQKRYLEIADRAGIPGILILTSRKNSLGIVCGTADRGLDWNKYLGTISTLYETGNIEGAKSALGNGIADIYSKSNVIDIVLNETAKKHTFITANETFWKDYKNACLPVTVATIDILLKKEFPNL